MNNYIAQMTRSNITIHDIDKRVQRLNSKRIELLEGQFIIRARGNFLPEVQLHAGYVFVSGENHWEEEHALYSERSLGVWLLARGKMEKMVNEGIR